MYVCVCVCMGELGNCVDERREEGGRGGWRATVVSLYMDMYTEAIAHKRSEIMISKY